MDVRESVDTAGMERGGAAPEAAGESVTPVASEAPAIPEPAPERRRARHPLRAVALAALVVCLLIAGAGSVVLTSRANQPSVPARLLSFGATSAHATTIPSPTPTPGHVVTIVANAGTSHSQSQQLAPQPPSGAGQVIEVSLSKQQLWAYQNGQVVYTTLVTTGMPALATPTGTFSIYYKVSDTEFISPWPPGSPYYYSPEHVNYAMEWLSGGYFIHDAPWRSTFGPGTEASGSHGCVEVPTPAGAWLYSWVGYGAIVQIVS